MIQWDIDLYEQLQDSAWELDSLAVAQECSAGRDERRSESEQNRTRAQALRQQAAQLLAQYWALPKLNASRTHDRRAAPRNPSVATTTTLLVP